MRALLFALLVFSLIVSERGDAEAAEMPHLLIITVDDMNCDSVGAFGCELEGTTPTIDAFAKQAMKFEHAHVQVGNCFPSRNVMWSGRYPHNTGVEGFYQVKDASYPHLVDLMKQAGYFVGIRGKVSHSTPYQPYAWDSDLSILDGEKQDVKNALSYYESTRRGIEMAEEAGKPFCLNVNISDPHKPFYAMGKQGAVIDDPNVPSHTFSADEVPIPGFLFDDPDVRKELAHYYSSVRRADDCFAAVMKAVDESGERNQTVVVFLSDHGMPLPFAKTALWNHSTRTPLLVQWPGVTKPGAVDDRHMVSAVDLLPTLLEIAGIESPGGFDGRSFAAVLRGSEQQGRESVYKVYNENSGGNRSPMRSVQTRRFGYLFNPWSDGNRVFKTATTGTLTYRAMVRLAAEDDAIAKRLELFQHGVPEEFYDYQNDPDALHNLIDDPNFQNELAEHRELMKAYMKASSDPMLEVFERREDPAQVSVYVDQVQAEADARRAARQKGATGSNRTKKNQRLFQLQVSEQVKPGQDLIVKVKHRLPADLGEQKFHVTLKGQDGKRIERIVQSAKGRGEFDVKLRVPADLRFDTVSIAAFVGEEYSKNLLHKTSGKVTVSK